MIGAAFGLGFTLGPLIGAAAIFLSRDRSAVSPWPGFAAAILSGMALAVAFFKLPESLRTDEIPETRRHFDLGALGDILAIPSLGLLLLTSFAAVFSLANFESTLSLTISDTIGEKIHHVAKTTPDWRDQFWLMLVFAYIGVIQCLVQGVLVRRLADHLKEVVLATIGSLLSIGGFVMLAILGGGTRGGVSWLMVATAVEVSGIAFVFPAISALISRRSDPAKQGGILGGKRGLDRPHRRLRGRRVALLPQPQLALRDRRRADGRGPGLDPDRRPHGAGLEGRVNPEASPGCLQAEREPVQGHIGAVAETVELRGAKASPVMS